VTPYLHENLSGDLIFRILHEFSMIAERNPAEAVPASYRPYIVSYTHSYVGQSDSTDAWYSIDRSGAFDKFLAEEDPQSLFEYLYRRTRALPPANPMASWDSAAAATLRARDPTTITTQADMRAYHRAIVEASWRRQQTIGPHGTLLPSLFMNANSQLIVYDNNDSDAEEDDESRVCNHCARTGAFCGQVQAQVSSDPADDAAVLLNGSCVDCYAHSRTNCSFGKALMVLRVLALLTVSQLLLVLSVCAVPRTSTVAAPLCRLSLAVCSVLLALLLCLVVLQLRLCATSSTSCAAVETLFGLLVRPQFLRCCGTLLRRLLLWFVALLVTAVSFPIPRRRILTRRWVRLLTGTRTMGLRASF
jgi:hypothetical protein